MTTIALKLRTSASVAKPARRAINWDLAGILALIGSSAAYALFTKVHLT